MSSSSNLRLDWSKKKMASPTPPKLYTVSSLLMAALFAISASFQFNDTDWYFWIPLYSCGSAVNLMSCCQPTFNFSAKTVQRMANFSLWLGIFLFVKLIVESFAVDNLIGILSLDMTNRVAREKLGSGLVFVSMILQLAASSLYHNNHFDLHTSLYFGMRVIVGVTMICAVSFVFLVLLTGSIIMHSASSSVQDELISPWQSKLAKYVDYGTVLVIATLYGLFFVLFLLLFIWVILKPTKSQATADKKENRLQDSISYGMAALVGISYGLSVVLHVYHKDQMEF